MKQHFADKLRDIANQKSENDETLIQKINSMFDRYAPELKEQIPECVQNDLVRLAKHKQHKMIISIDNYLLCDLSNEKVITYDDCKKDIEILKKFFTQAQSSPFIDYRKFDGGNRQKITYELYDSKYEIYYANGVFIFSIILSTRSLAKVLQNEGFKVSVLNSKKLHVEW